LKKAPYQLAVFGLTSEPDTLETQSRAQKNIFWPRIQKYCKPKYWRVGSDDDVI